MNKEIISDKQAIITIAFFIMGATVVLPTAVEAERDLWIAAGIGSIMALPFAFIYARLFTLFYGKGLYDILELFFGKIIGKIIGALYVCFALLLGALTIRDLGEFVVTVTLPETPKIVPMIIITILCSWVIKEGIEVVARWGEFFFPINVIFVTIAISFLTSVWEAKHILPIFYNGIWPVMKGAYSTFAFPYGEIIVFYMVFENLKRKGSYYKVFITGLVIGAVAIVMTSLSEIATLGLNGYKSTFFPSYNAVSRINVGDFIQRLEIIVSFVFLSGLFIKTSICLLAATKGVAKLFGLENYRFLVIPMGALMINISYISFENIIDLSMWSSRVWPFFIIPFEIAIPTIIFVMAEVKSRKEKAGGEKGE